MTQVNSPFLVRKLRPRESIDKLFALVSKLSKDDMLDSGQELNNYFDQLERTVEQMYRKMGGTADLIENTDIGFSQSFDFDEILNNVYEPEKQEERQDYYAISSAHTTSGSQFLRVSAPSSITLNSTPDDNEIVSVFINGGKGSTVTDGTETDTFVEDGIYMTYMYSAEAGEWVRGR